MKHKISTQIGFNLKILNKIWRLVYCHKNFITLSGTPSEMVENHCSKKVPIHFLSCVIVGVQNSIASRIMRETCFSKIKVVPNFFADKKALKEYTFLLPTVKKILINFANIISLMKNSCGTWMTYFMKRPKKAEKVNKLPFYLPHSQISFRYMKRRKSYKRNLVFKNDKIRLKFLGGDLSNSSLNNQIVMILIDINWVNSQLRNPIKRFLLLLLFLFVFIFPFSFICSCFSSLSWSCSYNSPVA